MAGGPDDAKARRIALISGMERDANYAADLADTQRSINAIRSAAADRSEGEYSAIARADDPRPDDFVDRFVNGAGPLPKPRKPTNRRRSRPRKFRKD